MIKLLRINCPSFVGQVGVFILPRSCGKTMFRRKIRFLEYLIHKYKDIIYMRDTDAVYFIDDKPESESLKRDISVFEKNEGRL